MLFIELLWIFIFINPAPKDKRSTEEELWQTIKWQTVTMGNVFANLFKNLFGKKEMRILMVSIFFLSFRRGFLKSPQAMSHGYYDHIFYLPGRFGRSRQNYHSL